ncbi:hypothetical protein [uncultured Alistipes sp.]|jgi:hypothetical protein|uniref:hypothetical protein n=1 Tax=uncultured Alistipes sp. TaxID=538949 RepID=UPI0025FD5E0F|nr:hypothetical protein [uncultured Alistipes sp.]
MKKSILFLALYLCTGLSLYAQEKHSFSYAVTVGTAIPVSAPSSTPFAFQILGYYNLAHRWAVGAGTGISFYEKTLIPLFGGVRYQIGRTRRLTPYLEIGAGYSFATASRANGGFFLNPSVGVRYPLKNRMRLQFAVGYELQELERLKTHTDEFFSKSFAEKLSHHSISLRLGLLF